VITPNPRLQIDIAEQLARALVSTPHHSPSDSPRSQVNHPIGRAARPFFNSLLVS
jgi:hypothetical protein